MRKHRIVLDNPRAPFSTMLGLVARRRPIQAVARWRCQRNLYAFAIEMTMAGWMRPSLAS